MSPTGLNNDILLSILSISPPKAATSIMATCRLLYHEGAKIVLQDPVDLNGSEKEALALLRFVQAENLSRCSYVRTLHIVMDTVPKSVANILAKVVPRMTGLERLGLAGEQMFESYPHLLPTFASLRSVKSLLVLEAGQQCCEMIRTLRSKLVFATIYFHPMKALTLSLAAPSHPIVMLKRSATTLQNLSCGYLFNTNPELTFLPSKISYPNLRTLSLSDSMYPNPVPFIRAFPNLAHLSVERRIAREGGALEMTEFQRIMNLQLQGPPEDRESLQWKHLQDFTGRVVDLWMLGLTCRIPRLSLEDAPAARPPLALTEALEYARPMRLTISFRGQPLTDVLGADFLGALRSQGASGLKHLIVLVDLMADDRALDVGRALNDIASAMSGLNLCHLQLGVHDVGLSEASSGGTSATARHQHEVAGTAPAASQSDGATGSAHATCTCSVDRASLNLAERTLDDLDAHEYAKRLISSIPSVNDAAVRIDRPHRCGGSQRIAILGVGDGAMVCTDGELVYHEVTKAAYERAKATLGGASDD
ncbi:hypothetical protein LXA43DRAFT_893157 [Ganoderma leucocontextum]|nr:hypothetical protein LXA43DRAFT_893157 [Ganoderma leucocontextum]